MTNELTSLPFPEARDWLDYVIRRNAFTIKPTDRSLLFDIRVISVTTVQRSSSSSSQITGSSVGGGGGKRDGGRSAAGKSGSGGGVDGRWIDSSRNISSEDEHGVSVGRSVEVRARVGSIRDGLGTSTSGTEAVEVYTGFGPQPRCRPALGTEDQIGPVNDKSEDGGASWWTAALPMPTDYCRNG